MCLRRSASKQSQKRSYTENLPIACCRNRTEFTFLISQRVLNGSPGRRTETFASTRRLPCALEGSGKWTHLLHVSVAGPDASQYALQLAHECASLLR